MAVARSCFYADHHGQRDGFLEAQDMGEQDFRYAICGGETLSKVSQTADILNTEFPVITETYHKGNLPQSASFGEVDAENISLSCIKPAEDGVGMIIRLTETAGTFTRCHVKLFDTEFDANCQPFSINTYRIADGKAVRCNFVEECKNNE